MELQARTLQSRRFTINKHTYEVLLTTLRRCRLLGSHYQRLESGGKLAESLVWHRKDGEGDGSVGPVALEVAPELHFIERVEA